MEGIIEDIITTSWSSSMCKAWAFQLVYTKEAPTFPNLNQEDQSHPLSPTYSQTLPKRNNPILSTPQTWVMDEVRATGTNQCSDAQYS